MNRNVRYIILVIFLLIFFGGVYMAVNSMGSTVEKSQSNGSTVSSTPSESPANNTPSATQSGKYVDYSPAVIQETTGTKVLFFHAPWCPQCRELEADIKKRGVPAGATIIKVDYDTNQTLRKKYGVTVQTTLVKVDDNGELLNSYVAYDEPSVEAVQNNLLR